ncbi:carbohydrate kinase family protein [Actinomyces respiraculi]|uniref:carbohydrate kinase family protein n=1 Tax=Actinomyces respiraculi TaxID=2744574 RepID=UPI001A7EE5E3|nr:carbohydrate kinase family protein [Actinomyces respiraculi]
MMAQAAAPGGAPTALLPMAPSTAHPVVAVGPVFLDVIMTGLSHAPRPGEEQWVSGCALMPGGAANQGVALARLGLPTALLCYLGTDAAGTLVRSMLEREHIDLGWTDAVEQQNVTTSLAFDGDRAMTTVGRDDAPSLAAFAQASTVPSAVVTDQRAVTADAAILTAWRSDNPRPCVVSDVGWDPAGAWDPADLARLDLVDVFTPNEGEATRYTRTTTAEQAACALAERVPLAVITRGGHGVVACDGSTLVTLPATPVRPVDTTGAGDSFTAGLVWALSHGLGLRAALSAGCLTASCTLGRPGGSANAPTLTEVAAHADSLDLSDDYDLTLLDLINRTTNATNR